MSKKISLATAIILMLLAILVTFQITYLSMNNRYTRKLNNVLASQASYDKLAYVDNLYKSNYIGTIDEKKLTDGIIKGYVYGSGDKHGNYMSAENYEEYLNNLRGDGIGIGISVIYNSDYGAIEVIAVMPDSPALDAGIQAGDLILAVDGKDVAEVGYSNAVVSVKGEIGTDVILTIARLDDKNNYEPQNITVIRGKYSDVTANGRMYENSNIGIVKISEFNLKTPEQFIAAVSDLKSKGAEKFIFDMRYNPGGELTSVSDILDYLLPAGPIIRIIDSAGKEEVLNSDANEQIFPMAVLINGKTASAAELFASSLKDYKKAKLIGTKSYGKGTMQTTYRLPDDSALTLSIRYYSPPFSDNYDGIGITPDIEVEMSSETAGKNIYKIQDFEDTQLLAAVELLNSEK